MTKEWLGGIDLDASPDSVSISMSTRRPLKNRKGYTVTFHSINGSFPNGSSVNDVVYTKTGKIVQGVYLEPTNIYGEFDDWYYDVKLTSKVDCITDKGEYSGTLDDDIDLYSKMIMFPRLAVQVYDIERDVGNDGNVLGITFGPAFGDNYVMSYKSHTPSGVTESGNYHRCIHDDSWDVVINWNDIDPYVYDQCLLEGCTHSVSLDPRNIPSAHEIDTLFSMGSYMQGDGEATLYAPSYFGGAAGGYGSTDSYSKSQVRAMLNGCDEYTLLGDESRCFPQDFYPVSDIYTDENCVFALFPECLKNAISFKYLDDSEHSLYDRLWLFSFNEVASEQNKYKVFRERGYGPRYRLRAMNPVTIDICSSSNSRTKWGTQYNNEVYTFSGVDFGVSRYYCYYPDSLYFGFTLR